MFETYKKLIADQFEAVLCTLNACVDQCPEAAWNAPVVHHAFCQVAFHVLFYTDHFLGENEEAFRRQKFHQENPHFFRDYEELEDRKPVNLYDKPLIKKYLDHCRTKASEVITAETAETMQARCGFERLSFSRAELYVYTIRHIQHHAAQLILRLRADSGIHIPWFKSGWSDG